MQIIGHEFCGFRCWLPNVVPSTTNENLNQLKILFPISLSPVTFTWDFRNPSDLPASGRVVSMKMPSLVHYNTVVEWVE